MPTTKKAPAGAAAAPATADAVLSMPVREGEEPWTAEEIAEVQGELQSDIERLRHRVAEAEEELAALMRDNSDGSGDDQADAGAKTFDREQEMSLAANFRDLLAQSELALEALNAGAYGVCEACGEPIGKARLQAFPRATLCVSCKQKQERR